MKLVLCLLFTFKLTFARSSCGMDFTVSSYSMDLNSYQETTPLNLSMQRTRVSYDFLCNFYFYDFGKGNANSYQRYLENKNGDKISYNLYKINGYKNILTELSDMKQNSDAIWGWSLATNQNYQDSFNVILSYDRSLIYPAGNYTDSVPVRIYSGLPFNDPRRESSSNLFLTFSIPSSIALSLVDAGSPFSEGDTTQTMDFGEIETGDTLEADLKVRSNAGYRIYMRSDNRGSLKHQLLNDKITYVLTVNNRSVNLKRGGKGDKVADFSGVTPHDGDNLRLKVVMGNPQSVQAGTYTDYVTITAETKD